MNYPKDTKRYLRTSKTLQRLFDPRKGNYPTQKTASHLFVLHQTGEQDGTDLQNREPNKDSVHIQYNLSYFSHWQALNVT